MNRLQKYVEQGAVGERTGRTAYAFDTSKLPEAIRGLDWRQVNGFSAAEQPSERKILQLQAPALPTASAETLLQRMLSKVDDLCAELVRPRGKGCSLLNYALTHDKDGHSLAQRIGKQCTRNITRSWHYFLIEKVTVALTMGLGESAY
jgi:hypothetical protein